MKKSIFILLAVTFACEPAKKAEKEIVPNEIGYQISEDGLKLPCIVIQNQLFKFRKIILKLIMKKIPQPFVT